MDSLSHYLLNGYGMSFRRSMDPESVDPILVQVKSVKLCKKLDFCKPKIENFVNNYVTAVAKAVEAVFDGILDEKSEVNQDAKAPIFQKLKGVLHDVRKILKTANDKVTEEKEAYLWVGVLKKISARFQRKAMTYIIDRIDADKNINEVKKTLSQKLVTNIATVEAKAEKKMCEDYHLCLRGLECTKALNTVLERLISLSDEKMRMFIKAFYEALPETTFYARLSEPTANELQVILNDMAYFESIPTKEILTTVHQTVENRINAVNSEAKVMKGQDIQLVHIILSDMDHIYSRQKGDPFHHFLDFFMEWSKADPITQIAAKMKEALNEIEEVLQDTSEDLILKMSDEVRVFLEITVDP